MRSILPEWYEPDDETVEKVITTSIIAGRGLDAMPCLETDHI